MREGNAHSREPLHNEQEKGQDAHYGSTESQGSHELWYRFQGIRFPQHLVEPARGNAFVSAGSMPALLYGRQ